MNPETKTEEVPSKIEQQPSGDCPPRYAGFWIAAALAVCATFSWFVGGWVLAWAGNYMATGDNTPHQDFLTPIVYTMLFYAPFWVAARR